MTTTNKNHLQMVDESSMAVPPAGNFNLGYVNGELTQMDSSGDPERILTESSLGEDVRSTKLTGLSLADSSPIAASDTVLQAFGKLQAQDENFVPTTLTINAYPLTSDITLTTDDVSEGTANLYHVQSDFAESDQDDPSFIKNKPSIQDGHVILNSSGTAMNQRSKLRFQGDGMESVADDGTNDATIVTIVGGGESGMTNPMTDLGDIIVGVDSSGSPGKLSIGSDGQVLTVNSDATALLWMSPKPIANLWPSNVLFNYSSYARKPYFTYTNYVTALDGWLVYQGAGDIENPTYFSAVPALTVNAACNDLCFNRSNGNSGINGNTLYMNRPFTWKETAPLRGQSVTFSFGLKFGTDFPKDVEDYGINVVVNGTTRTTSQIHVNYAGSFQNAPIVIKSSFPILSAPTDRFERMAISFDVPEGATQICISMRHKPLGTGTEVGDDYKFYLRRPALRIGADASEPEFPSRVEDFWGNSFRFQRVLATYSGSVTSGQVITQRIPFPIPMDDVGVVTCIRGYDAELPVGFPAAARSQASDVTKDDFVITRTANASGTGFFRTWYSFGILLWTFEDNIPDY